MSPPPPRSRISTTVRRGSTTTRFKGLSKSVHVHTFKRGVRHTEILHARDQARRRKEMAERRAAELRCTSVLANVVPCTDTFKLVVLSPKDQELVKRMWEDLGVDVDVEPDEPVSSARCNEQGGMGTTSGEKQYEFSRRGIV